MSEQLPTFMRYFDIKQIAHVNELVGVQATNLWWTIQQWELRAAG